MTTEPVSGLAQIERQLRALAGLEKRKALRRAVKAAIQPALERARAAIPVGVDEHRTYKGRDVKPGFARRSIRVAVKVSRDKMQADAILGVRAEAFYAVQFVELGTTKTPAKPWLRPAFRSTADQQAAELAAELRKSIAEAAARTA